MLRSPSLTLCLSLCVFAFIFPPPSFEGLSVTGAEEVHGLTFPWAKNSLQLQREEPDEKPKRVSSHPPTLLCLLFTILCVWNIIGAWLWNDFILYNFAQLRSCPGWKARLMKKTWKTAHTELSILPREWKHWASEGKWTHYQLQVIYSWAEFGFIADWLIKYWRKPSLRALLTDAVLLLPSVCF